MPWGKRSGSQTENLQAVTTQGITLPFGETYPVSIRINQIEGKVVTACKLVGKPENRTQSLVKCSCNTIIRLHLESPNGSLDWN